MFLRRKQKPNDDAQRIPHVWSWQATEREEVGPKTGTAPFAEFSKRESPKRRSDFLTSSVWAWYLHATKVPPLRPLRDRLGRSSHVGRQPLFLGGSL